MSNFSDRWPERVSLIILLCPGEKGNGGANPRALVTGAKIKTVKAIESENTIRKMQVWCHR